MEKILKRQVGKGANPDPDHGDWKGSPTPTNPNKGGRKWGGNLRAMKELKPEAVVPPLLYCNPVNDKGGPFHAPDCDHRSGCVLQLERLHHSNDGKTVNHQDHFKFTIISGFRGTRRHYEDECNIQQRESDKLKRQEAEHQKTQTPFKTPKNRDAGGTGGGKWDGGDGNPYHNPQRRSSAPASAPSLTKADPKKRPQLNNAPPTPR